MFIRSYLFHIGLSSKFVPYISITLSVEHSHYIKMSQEPPFKIGPGMKGSLNTLLDRITDNVRTTEPVPLAALLRRERY